MKSESEWVNTSVEAIVTSEIWEQCNKLIAQSLSKQRRPAQKPVHIFAGLAFCGCEEKMYVPSNSPKYLCRKCHNKIPIVDLDGIFCDEIKRYSLSPDAVAAYLQDTDKTIKEKEQLLKVQQSELQKNKQEIERVYRLYQEGQLDSAGFGRFYKPLEERSKQLEENIPQLQAEIDLSKVNNLSAQEIVSEATTLYQQWQKLESQAKREIVETITDRIIIGKDEITIDLYYLPSGKDMAFGWRKGWLMNPFCHLVIETVRYDSTPLISKLFSNGGKQVMTEH